MKLSEKGRFAAPPVLKPTHAQALSTRLAAWQGVQARTHWYLGDENVVDGADFYLGEDELGHLHLDGEAHVAVGPTLRKALVARGLAQPFQWSNRFVTWQVSSQAAAEHAEWLFSLARELVSGAAPAALISKLDAVGEN